MEWMKISSWVWLVWGLWKAQGDGQSSRAGPAKEVPPWASSWLRPYSVTSQTGRVNIWGTLIIETWSPRLACVCMHFFSKSRGFHRKQETSSLGGCHFTSWKKVFGAEKMEVCDLKCKGLVNTVVFLPIKIKWSIYHSNQTVPSPLKGPCWEAEAFSPQNKYLQLGAQGLGCHTQDSAGWNQRKMTRMSLMGEKEGRVTKGNVGFAGKGAWLAGSSPGLYECQETFWHTSAHLHLSAPPGSLLPAKCSKVYSSTSRTHPTPSPDKASFSVTKTWLLHPPGCRHPGDRNMLKPH